MRLPLLACLLLPSCGWGAFYEGCEGIDGDVAAEMAEARGVLDVWERLDVVCQPRADVVIDCRNETAEACTERIGSAVHRGRVYLSSEATEGPMPLLEHEFTHFGGPRQGDSCEDHPPRCDGLP
jgi:hypothetical protein